jgi:hypothetical protein
MRKKIMQNEFYRLDKENGLSLVVKIDDSNNIDHPLEIGVLGHIIGFDGDHFSISEKSKKDMKEILEQNEIYFSIPLFYTKEGIYTKEKIMEKLSGCIYLSYEEIHRTFSHIKDEDEQIDAALMEMASTIQLYEKYLLNKVYKYQIFDENHNLISDIGSFYDIENCIEAGKQEITSVLENKF